MRRKAILAVTLGVLVFGFVYVWTFGFFPGKDLKRSGHDYAKQNVIAAIKRHVARSLMWDEALQIVFVFNEKHELTKFDVMPVYTSF
jgi:hypothetical protein